jgi:UDP-glucose 4-epimerase
MINTKCVWVTGAHGFIGRNLAKQLATSGYRVAGLGHGFWSDAEALKWGINQWINGDINLENLIQLNYLAGTPMAVFHLAGGGSVGAAIVNPRADFYRSVASTVELLDWVRLYAPNVTLVVASSAAVYGDGHIGPISEDSKLNPFSPYGWHKQIMENLCLSYKSSYDINLIIGRLFSVYGAGLKKQLLWDLCNKLYQGEGSLLLDGSGNELRDFIHVHDAVRALELLITKASRNVSVYNIGTGIGFSVRDLVTLVVQELNYFRLAKDINFSSVSRKGDPLSLVADITQLKQLGFLSKQSLSEGVVDYINWFSDEIG